MITSASARRSKKFASMSDEELFDLQEKYAKNPLHQSQVEMEMVARGLLKTQRSDPNYRKTAELESFEPSTPSEGNLAATVEQLIQTQSEDLIARSIEWANDKDINWEYDNPEDFAWFAECQLFEEVLPEMLEGDFGYSGVSEESLRAVVPEDFLEELREAAKLGDFDI